MPPHCEQAGPSSSEPESFAGCTGGVSVSADTHVNKGVNRPLIPDDLRAQSLAALECVDWVCLSTAPTAVELLDHEVETTEGLALERLKLLLEVQPAVRMPQR